MIVYARYTISISGIKTTMDWVLFLRGWIREAIYAGIMGHNKTEFNFRDEGMESDIIVELDETAGEIPPYLEPVCKNCSHWRGEPATISGRCVCPKFRYEFTKGADPEADGVVVEFDEEWGMLTGPEFGCIHYEERA